METIIFNKIRTVLFNFFMLRLKEFLSISIYSGCERDKNFKQMLTDVASQLKRMSNVDNFYWFS